jgi:hypothetical protein
MNLSALRSELATALAPISATVYAFPPKALPTPSVSVVPGSPYITPVNLGTNKFRAKFQVTAAVATMDNEAALDNLETLIFGIYSNLPTGWVVSETTQPNLIDLGQSIVLTADVNVEKITQIGD